MRTPHKCPGCGREGIPYARVSCRDCWYRLPPELQRAITRAYAGGSGQGSIPHLRALAEAINWYRANPPIGSTNRPRGEV